MDNETAIQLKFYKSLINNDVTVPFNSLYQKAYPLFKLEFKDFSD